MAKTVEFTKSQLALFAGYDTSDLSDDDFATLTEVALSRLQVLLCDPALDSSALDSRLLPVLADLVAWTASNNAGDDGIQSETAENYSYSKDGTAPTSSIARLREKYADVIEALSKCDDLHGAVENPEYKPLWKPDYYKEILQ